MAKTSSSKVAKSAAPAPASAPSTMSAALAASKHKTHLTLPELKALKQAREQAIRDKAAQLAIQLTDEALEEDAAERTDPALKDPIEEYDDDDEVDLELDGLSDAERQRNSDNASNQSDDEEDLPDMVVSNGHDEDDDDNDAEVSVVVSSTGRRKRRASSPSGGPSKKAKTDPPTIPATPSTPIKPKNGKIRYSMFSPRTQNLLRKGKGDVRADTLLKNAYPDQKRKVEHYTAILKNLVFDEERSTADMLEAFLRLQENPTLLENATILISYARGDLNLSVIFFARGIVGKFDLGHQGGQMETKAVIVWLKEVFMYGGLDVQRRVYNKSLKFQPTWIIDFMRWYLFMCNGKQDGVAFHAIMKLQYFPPEIYAYILTAVRHALCDWEDGVEKKRPFTDDNSSFYFGYLAQLKKLQLKSPTYFDRISRSAFKACLSQANKDWLLQKAAADDNEDDTDYAALEASAQAAALAEAA